MVQAKLLEDPEKEKERVSGPSRSPFPLPLERDNSERFSSWTSRLDDEEFRWNSSAQWTEALLNIFTSRVTLRISNHLLFNFVWSVVVSILYWRDPALPALSSEPNDFLGSVLGLLLAFRTSQSYDRFLEGRKLWTDVSKGCRQIRRIALVYLKDSEDLHSLLRHTAAFGVALKQHLRQQSEVLEFVSRGILSSEEVAELYKVNCRNKPLAVTCRLELLARSVIDSFVKENGRDSAFVYPLTSGLQNGIQDLVKAVSEGERLARVPEPPVYAKHTSRVLSVFTMTLPFALAAHENCLFIPFSTLLVSFAFFATEELGHMISNPFFSEDNFELIPIESYVAALSREMMGADSSPEHRRTSFLTLPGGPWSGQFFPAKEHDFLTSDVGTEEPEEDAVEDTGDLSAPPPRSPLLQPLNTAVASTAASAPTPATFSTTGVKSQNQAGTNQKAFVKEPAEEANTMKPERKGRTKSERGAWSEREANGTTPPTGAPRLLKPDQRPRQRQRPRSRWPPGRLNGDPKIQDVDLMGEEFPPLSVIEEDFKKLRKRQGPRLSEC
uniref:Bestrophin homolog n=1 Tax=Chromera velia CCMP2878 TaxID=1169474 RepID=A0A0G4GAM5_9ALVE|eukprot:Cvel_21025.t1-p1 / transcript=Cvel_21025.t1 / gene=Cvel_21025 / organism=Chromera_velia_CCMP2878 / gene_product=UPF0187 protein YneE, putative / transcript_product=UPF0187 protein YneE, putative / location=Cvel_scaffold1938:26633-30675(-) / protein_length=553 / sequence_SO=supercontig / SO=protein_coding / is_pseudo=false